MRTRFRSILSLGAGGVVLLSCLIHVPADRHAVRSPVPWGGGFRLLEPGIHFRLPFLQKVYRYPAGPQRVSMVATLRSREGIRLEVRCEARGRADPARLVEWVGEDPEAGVVERIRGTVLQGVAESGPVLEAAPLLLHGMDDGASRLLVGRLSEAGILEPVVSFDPVALADNGKVAGLPEIIPGSGSSPTGVRILLVGWDGADWAVIRPLLAEGKLPHLADLLRNGLWGDLKSFEPLLSPLLWTTVVTGVSPDRHRILDFLVADPETGEPVPIPSTFRRAKALWNLFTEFSRSTAFIGWWATWPAEPVAGTMVSDRIAYSLFQVGGGERSLEAAVYPPGELRALRPVIVGADSITFEDVRRFVDIPRQEYRQALQGLRGPVGSTYRDPVSHLLKILASTRTYHRIALELLSRDQPEILGIYYQGIDEVSHRFAHFAPPRMGMVSETEFRKFHRAVEEFYRFQDELLGELLKGVGAGTLVMVLSDHGFLAGSDRPPRLPPDIEGRPDRWHRARGILMLSGGPLRRGGGGSEGFPVTSPGDLEGWTLYDIAPTLLYAAGLPVSREMPGRPRFEAFLPEFVRRTPLYLVDSYDPPDPGPPSGPLRSPVDEEMVARLRTLGYLGISPDRGPGQVPGGEGGTAATYHANLAYLRVSAGELPGAMEEVDRALLLQPDYIPALVLRARIFEEQGEYRRALEVFWSALEEMVRQGRREPGTFIQIARLLEKLQETGSGLARLSGRSGDFAPDPEFQVAIGQLQLAAGDPEAAEASFRRAVSRDPAGEEGIRRLFFLLLRQGRQPEAEAVVADAFSLNPRSVLLHNLRGLLFQERGDFGAAEREFHSALGIAPGDAPTLSNLGALYGRTGRIQESVRVLRRAVELDPDHPDALVNLAGALGRLGETSEVIYRLEVARLRGIDPTRLRNALGLAYYQDRQWARAERLFRESLESDPEQPEVRRFLEQLERDRGTRRPGRPE